MCFHGFFSALHRNLVCWYKSYQSKPLQSNLRSILIYFQASLLLLQRCARGLHLLLKVFSNVKRNVRRWESAWEKMIRLQKYGVYNLIERAASWFLSWLFIMRWIIRAAESRSFEPFTACATPKAYYACIIINFTDLFATFISCCTSTFLYIWERGTLTRHKTHPTWFSCRQTT